jgi:hypothetical protein
VKRLILTKCPYFYFGKALSRASRFLTRWCSILSDHCADASLQWLCRFSSAFFARASLVWANVLVQSGAEGSTSISDTPFLEPAALSGPVEMHAVSVTTKTFVRFPVEKIDASSKCLQRRASSNLKRLRAEVTPQGAHQLSLTFRVPPLYSSPLYSKPPSSLQIAAHTFSCAMERSFLYHGRMYVSDYHVCFNSNIFSKGIKVRVSGLGRMYGNMA